MDFVKPPGPLSTTGEISKNWRIFKQRFELFLTASEPSDKPRPKSSKAALLLSIAGEEAIEIFNTFNFAEDESNADYATVVKKFEEYCAAQHNEVHERYVFRNKVQAPGEPFEHFLRELKKQARLCNFDAQMDSMIRDQIVYGTNDDKVQQKLLRDNSLTLQKAEQVCKAAEVSEAHKKIWAGEQKQVDPIHKTSASYDKKQPKLFNCGKCGRTHAPRSCPAFGLTCKKCQKQNHFAKCCRTSTQVGELQDSEDDFEVLDVSSRGAMNQRDWIVQARVKNLSVELKVDTGAQANLLPFGT
uniref:Putative tick transposon n=1 Tax=Ixodes ricinus TaxID=34613 RepID=A0A6B0V865_IXORI